MNRPTHITAGNPEFRSRNKCLVPLISCCLIFFLAGFARAGSATWKRNARSGDWNTKTNWTPAHVPNGGADIATFTASNTTAVSLSANTDINGITFTRTSSAYNITVNPDLTFTISGVGITNNSGTTQNFVTSVDATTGGSGIIEFDNSSTAGSGTFFANSGGTVTNRGGGVIFFNNSSNAGSATITNSGGTILFSFGAGTVFQDTSTAGSATINNNGADGFSGLTTFRDTSTAGNATITNTRPGGAIGGGGATLFVNNSTADSATIIINDQSSTIFFDNSSAGSAIIT